MKTRRGDRIVPCLNGLEANARFARLAEPAQLGSVILTVQDVLPDGKVFTTGGGVFHSWVRVSWLTTPILLYDRSVL